MALISCPECRREVSDKAAACPSCGYPIAGKEQPGAYRTSPFPGYEYKSKRTVMGMPLVHIVYGPSWGGGFKPAKGFIAVGNVAIGIFAIGGLALGVVTLAGIGLGIISIAGMALGFGAGVGGFATGYFAMGGVAVGVYAIGGLAIGVHTLFNDPGMLDGLKKLFGR